MKIICPKCGRDFQVIRAGVLVKELFQKNTLIYRIWAADLLGCPGCVGRQVVARFADNPIANHWELLKMKDALTQCALRTLGIDLFEWKEFVPKK